MIQPERRLSSLLHEMLHLLHEKNPSDSRRHWTPLNKYNSDNILTNSWLITQSDPFFNLTKSYGVPLSTMSYVLCETSSTTGSQQESRRLEKDSSDISKKHATRPAVFSQSAKAAAHSHRKEPIKIEIQVQVQKQYKDQPPSYLKTQVIQKRAYLLTFSMRLESHYLVFVQI